MKRAAQPEEIAPAFVFMAAPVCSSYITGEILPSGPIIRDHSRPNFLRISTLAFSRIAFCAAGRFVPARLMWNVSIDSAER